MNAAAPFSAATQPSEPVVIGDEVLLDRLRGGDLRAGEALAARYLQPILRYLQRLAGDDHVAEELHQQTWLSVLENVDRFNPGAVSGGFKAWLFRIATNKANDYWRARAREKSAKEGVRQISQESDAAADHRLENAEQQQKLRAAIEKLPENQRQVLLMRYYGNMKFTEIAEALECPLNTALGRMHKAMMKLKQLMDE